MFKRFFRILKIIILFFLVLSFIYGVAAIRDNANIKQTLNENLLLAS